MYSRYLRWVLAGAAAVVIVAAAGAVAAALWRGCALADEEDAIFPPVEEPVDVDSGAPAG